MNFWIDIVSLMLRTALFTFINPLFWLVLILVFFQYRRVVAMEKSLFGQAVNNMWRQTFYSMLLGIAGGIFGSFFLLLLGISLESIGIVYLWPVAILLLLINPRYLCFAYAGGIVAVTALILQAILPAAPFLGNIEIIAGLLDIHLPGLLTLVGILHLTEAFLIYMSGHTGASPVYLKAPGGEIVGGYTMQRFWPLPLMGLWAMVVAETTDMFVGGVSMPEWWPLLGTVMNVGLDEKVIYLMVPVVAGLGYSDIALSTTPYIKRIKTAKNLALYSLLLSGAAITAAFVPAMLLPAALLSPLGHEYLIKKGNDDEFSAPPLFRTDGKNGLQVMAVIPGSPASKSGLRAGDRIVGVNDHIVNAENEFYDILRISYQKVSLKIVREGQYMNLPVQIYPWPINQFGIIFAPGKGTTVYVEMKQSSLLDRLFRRNQGR